MRRHLLLLGLFLAALSWSVWQPKDRFTWVLEVFPALLGAVLLAATYRRFRLTDLAYGLLFVHALILLVGGHYTYAEVPGFSGWSRNPFDRIGHFAQGFVPAILAREILLRTSPLKPGKWLDFLVASVCLAFSACYELFEAGTAILTGTAADAFLGTQGDVWDTQKDMATALVGAVSALGLLGRLHDRLLGRLDRG